MNLTINKINDDDDDDDDRGEGVNREEIGHIFAELGEEALRSALGILLTVRHTPEPVERFFERVQHNLPFSEEEELFEKWRSDSSGFARKVKIAEVYLEFLKTYRDKTGGEEL